MVYLRVSSKLCGEMSGVEIKIEKCYRKVMDIYSFIVFSYPSKNHFFKKLINEFIYFWMCWVCVSVRGLSLVAASEGHSSSQCVGLSLSRPLLLRSTSSRRASSVVVAHGPSCSAACGIFPDQGSNPCPLHQQADSQPLCHQGSPKNHFLKSWLDTRNIKFTILTILSGITFTLLCNHHHNPSP